MNVMARPKAIEKLAPAAPAAQPHSSGDWWDERDWFDIREAARRLRVSPLTVRRMVKRGDFYEPAHFGPGILRWSEEGYRRWFAARAGLDAAP
jgi:predicted DNA-binding transcriptional regulator AlpA